MQLSRQWRVLVGTAALRGANAVLGIGAGVVLARALGAKSFGAYTTVLTAVTVASTLVQFGIPTLVTREVAAAHAGDDLARANDAYKWGHSRISAISIGMTALLFLILVVGERHLDREKFLTCLIALPLCPLLAWNALRSGVLNGVNRFIAAQLPECAIKPALSLLGAVLLLGVLPPRPSVAIGIQVCAVGVAFAAGIYLLHRYFTNMERAVPRDGDAPRPTLVAAASFSLVSGSTVFNQYIDILSLSVFRSAHDVGIYRAAWQLSLLGAFGTMVGGAIFPALFARYRALGSANGLSSALRMSRLVAVATAAPFAAIYFFAPTTVLTAVYGSQFGGASALLMILGGLQLFHAAVGPLGSLLGMCGHERESARAHLASIGLNCALNIILVHSYGAIGAACATAASYAFLAGCLVVQKRKYL